MSTSVYLIFLMPIINYFLGKIKWYIFLFFFGIAIFKIFFGVEFVQSILSLLKSYSIFIIYLFKNGASIPFTLFTTILQSTKKFGVSIINFVIDIITYIGSTFLSIIQLSYHRGEILKKGLLNLLIELKVWLFK
jgi:hypothetical protein